MTGVYLGEDSLAPREPNAWLGIGARCFSNPGLDSGLNFRNISHMATQLRLRQYLTGEGQ